MTNILHLGKYSISYRGGIETVMKQSSEGAAQHGHVISTIAFTKGETKKIINQKNIKHILCKPTITIASQPISAYYLIKAIITGRKSDIIHLHAPNILGALAIPFFRKKQKIIIHWHSDIIGKGLLGKIVRPIEKIALMRADRIVCTSAAYAEDSSSLTNFQEKISIIPIGIKDSKNQTVLPDIYSRIENITKGKKILLSVGRLVPYKGFDILIESLKHLPSDCIAIIVGHGPEHNALREISKQRKLSEKIIFLGHTETEALHVLFQKATIFCLPSLEKSEAFGVVQLEAMSYGLPIVSTNIHGSGVPWVNKNNESGLVVPPNDADSLGKAFSLLFSDEEKRLKLAKGARNRYERLFTEEIYISKLLLLYSEVLKNDNAES